MLKLLLLLLAFTQGGGDEAPVAAAYPLPEVLSVEPFGPTSVLLGYEGGSCLVDLVDLEVLPGPAGVAGFPPLAVTTNPSAIETTYTSSAGQHKVVTSCKGMSEDLCALKHAQQLAAMQRVFPKIG